jgi:hypothetical protein
MWRILLLVLVVPSFAVADRLCRRGANRELAKRLYGDPPQDPVERRRRSARVTRMIQLLRAHGMLAKVPRSRRYRVTANGERLFSTAICLRHKHFPTELTDAA